jgi:Tol biopolymer transport system component
MRPNALPGRRFRALPWALFVLLGVASIVVFALLLSSRLLRGNGRPELALGTDPISLYVVNDGKVEERRSGVSPAWSPDGKRLAYKGDFDGNLWIDDRAFPLGVGPDGRVQWTPDGRSLLFEGNGIRLLDVRTGTDRLVAPGTLPALSPDGRTVAYLRYTPPKRIKSAYGSALQIVSVAEGKPRVLARTQGSAYGPHFESRPQWLPDGTGVMVARRVAKYGPWAVELVNLDGSRRVVVPRIGGEFALSPDGRLIAYQQTNYRRSLVVTKPGERGRVWELGKLLPKRYSSLTEYGGLTWSPDGDEVAFYLGGADISSASSDSLLQVYALDVGTGKIRRVAEIRDAISASLAWNPHPDE